MRAVVIPNIMEIETYWPAYGRTVWPVKSPHIVVSRNLEQLYGIDTAIRAFALVLASHPDAVMSIAGSGPELQALRDLSREQGVESAVHFHRSLGDATNGRALSGRRPVAEPVQGG
jgi:glycosyltransferase involved in cell wall biosynthesis